MTERESRGGLSRRAREFVGVGASVGAGCHPCVTHHVKEGADAGIDAAELLAAVMAAERVTADSAARMATHARRQLPAAVGTAAAGGTVRDATLAALGAAVAANSMPNIERYLTEAAEVGVSREELVDAVRVAHEVQANAARIHARRTDTLLAAALPVSQGAAAAQSQAEECGESCPCHDEDAGSGGEAVSAPGGAPAGEAMSAGQACADAAAAEDDPPADDPRPAPAAESRAAPGVVTAGAVPLPAMLSACCAGLPA